MVAGWRWCAYMSTSFGESVLWWDREFDSTGKRIRMDVRCAAREIWEDACKQTRILIGEACAAALLMERSVAQISRYFDGRGIPVSGQDVKRLLTCAFARRLRRYAAKLRRIRLVGDMSQIAALQPARNLTIDEDRRLDAEKIIRQLSERSRRMYELRRQGFDWRETARIFNTTPAAARAEYSRDLRRAKAKTGSKSSPSKT